MDWNELLTSVRDAYRNAVDGNQPISSDNYLKLLAAFGALAEVTSFNEAYENDFRRNIPGGSRLEGSYDEVVGTLTQKISAAKKFAGSNPLYPAFGEGVAQNLIAIASLASSESTNQILSPMQNLLEDIAKGKL